ncbi:hypothetical protein IW262DRAFT_1486327 [Armillaria fumosa]|nr:hypothetical protein IW262DRAFT_1486327 [Armillaria fumosa]
MTLGAMYLGAMVAAILFGITNLQTVVYYKKYPDDWWVYRYSVASLWYAKSACVGVPVIDETSHVSRMLDTLHVALSTHALYHYLITLYGSFFITDDIICLYTVRLWKGLIRNNCFHYSLSSLLSIPKIRTSICVVFTAAMVSDFIIAFPMCYYLHKSRSVTNFSSTSKKLLNLMRLVVITGLATSVCSLLILITYLVWPSSFIFFGITFILPKLYINSLLAMLNAWKSHDSKSGGSHIPRVLRFTPNNCPGDPGEPRTLTSSIKGVDIVLTETPTLDHPKDGRNLEV